MILSHIKKGQAALWIIVSVAVFAIIILLFLVSRRPLMPATNEINLGGIVKQCMEDNLEKTIDIMIPQGGFVNPNNYKTYKNIKVPYLIQNIGYYKPGVNQHPMYISEIKKEIYEDIFPAAKECFESAIEGLEEKDYNITQNELNLSVELSQDLVLLNINKEIIISKNDNVQKFKDFEIRVKSPLYNLAKVANEITNQEAKYCYFEYLGYTILYPRFSIRRFVFSDFTEIYSIEDKESKKEFNIAVRGCAIPPGI